MYTVYVYLRNRRPNHCIACFLLTYFLTSVRRHCLQLVSPSDTLSEKNKLTKAIKYKS